MPQKTSFCNASLLRSDARRYWPLLFLYVTAWVAVLPLSLLRTGQWMSGAVQRQVELNNAVYQAAFGAVVMSLIFGCLTAMAVWSYLMNARSVGLAHALPVTRTQQYFSHFAAGFGMLTAGNVLVFCISALCAASCGFVPWGILASWLLLTELMCLFFFALASLCAMVTGWLLAVPVLYGAANVLAILLHLLVRGMQEIFYYGYANGSVPEAVMWLTPVGKLWNAISNNACQWITANGEVYDEWVEYGSCMNTLSAESYTVCAVYAAVGLALLALVWWLYEKRPSESAGDAVSFRCLRPVTRWIVGLCGGWGLGLFLHYVVLYGNHGNVVQLLVCQLIMGVICFFGTQMLLQKKFRIFRKRWWVETAAMVLVLSAVTLCVKADIGGYQHRVPDAANVTGVTVRGVIDFDTSDPETIETLVSLHRAILTQYDTMGAPGESGESQPTTIEDSAVTGTEASRYITLRYKLSGGGTLERSYNMYVAAGSEVYQLLNEMANSRANLLGLTNLDRLEAWGGVDAAIGGYIDRYSDGAYVDLTLEQMKELLRLLYADIDGNKNGVDLLDEGKTYNSDTWYGVNVNFRYASGETDTVMLNLLPQLCTQARQYVEKLAFNVPIDGTADYRTETVPQTEMA